MTLPDFLFRTDKNTYRFVGHRIDLYHVVTLYLNGHTAAMIHDDLPTLSREVIDRAVAFYEANKPEVDAYLRDWNAEYKRLSKLPQGGPTTEQLRRRFTALRSAESA